MSATKIRCEFCGHEGAYGTEIESRRGKFACIDTRACDRRDDAAHRAAIAALRKRRREGDELSEAELHTLADAS